MKLFTQPLRVLRIYFVFIRYGLGGLIPLPRFLEPLKHLRYVNPWFWLTYRTLSRGERILYALQALGPIFIKFGQVLSTRRDLLPDDIANALAKLQDQVPAFSGSQAVEIIEKSFGKKVSELFEYFEQEAFASASVAQVHAARLPGGKAVVVKVLRPKIKKTIDRDIGLLYSLATVAEKYWSHGQRLRPCEIVEEFSSTLENEQDLMYEAANASQLRRNFDNSPLLYVPEVYWNYCRPKVMVMERISGIPVSDIDALKAQKINLKNLAESGVEIFFTQVFRDSFFHADMHPGNIFVSTENPENPKYLGVDFGIMGTLDDGDKRYLAENFLAFFNRDYHRVAQLHVESGWVPADTRVDQFESAIRTVCEPIFEKPIKDISFGQLLVRLFRTAGRFNMPVQPQLMLLQKTLLNVEGLGRQLYPDLDLWTTAKPFLENWMRTQVGPKALIKKICAKQKHWAEKFPELPDLIYKKLTQPAPIVLAEKKQISALPARRAFLRGASFSLLVLALLAYFYQAAQFTLPFVIVATLILIFSFF